MTTTTDPAARRALAFALETTRHSADTAEPWDAGTALDTPSLDQVWSLNTLVSERPVPELSLEDVEAELEKRFAGRRYASAAFWHEPDGDRMAAAAKERGW